MFKDGRILKCSCRFQKAVRVKLQEVLVGVPVPRPQPNAEMKGWKHSDELCALLTVVSRLQEEPIATPSHYFKAPHSQAYDLISLQLCTKSRRLGSLAQ